MEIENGKYYDLGKKTYTLFIIQQTSFAVIFLVAAIIMGILDTAIGSDSIAGQPVGESAAAQRNDRAECTPGRACTSAPYHPTGG